MINFKRIQLIRHLLDNRELMPKSVCLSSGLLQFHTVWTASHHLKQIAKGPEHVQEISTKKDQV